MTRQSLTELECCVLGVVWRDGPCTAYDIRKSFEQSATTSWRASTGSIYPLIRKLEKKGLVTVYAVIGSKRQSKLIRITKEGLSKVEEWVSVSPDWLGESVADPIRTRFQFLETIAKPKRKAVLDEWITRTCSAIDCIETEIQNFDKAADQVEILSHRGVLLQLQARQKWLELLKQSC